MFFKPFAPRDLSHVTKSLVKNFSVMRRDLWDRFSVKFLGDVPLQICFSAKKEKRYGNFTFKSEQLDYQRRKFILGHSFKMAICWFFSKVKFYVS